MNLPAKSPIDRLYISSDSHFISTVFEIVTLLLSFTYTQVKAILLMGMSGRYYKLLAEKKCSREVHNVGIQF